MSQASRSFLDVLKEGVSEAMGEMGDEIQRLGVQGQAEIGSALFTGQGYVPYGQGQNRDMGREANEGVEPLRESPELEQEQQRGGREM